MSDQDLPRFVSVAPLDEVVAELHQYADGGQAVSRAACGRVLVELAEALGLLANFDVFDSVPDDHGYVGSQLQEHTADILIRHGLPAMNQRDDTG